MTAASMARAERGPRRGVAALRRQRPVRLARPDEPPAVRTFSRVPVYFLSFYREPPMKCTGWRINDFSAESWLGRISDAERRLLAPAEKAMRASTGAAAHRRRGRTGWGVGSHGR
jgi:hypothetical protein